MADGREEVLELDPDQELDVLDEGEEDQPEDGEQAEEDEDGEETVVGFEGEEAAPAPEGDSSVIRELRKANRELAKRVAEHEHGEAPKRIEVGEEPTLEGCDYDEDRFKADWKAWDRRKADADAQETEAQTRAKADKDAWDKRIQAFEAGKSRLKATDFEDAEAEVQAALPKETLALILRNETISAELVLALSRSPATLAQLSKLDLPDAAMMIGELRSKLKVTKRKLPEPDRPLRGNAAPGANADKQLAKLEAEAERTGDRTALSAYRRKLKQKAN